MNHYKDEPPILINEEGVKWWSNPSMTQWCKRKDRNGISLNWEAYYIETPEGCNTIVLVDEGGNIVYDNQQTEACASYVDMVKLSRSFK